MSIVIDLAGQRFGRLVVINRAENSKTGKAKWNCFCDCSAKTVVFSDALTSGHTNSCGCIRIEKTIKRNTKHGLSKDIAYSCWKGINKRCYNKNDKSYVRYGGRGIAVCKEWRSSFVNFVNDMPNYKKGLTIERIDNYGNYCKDNCKWATNKEQANNKRNNRVISFEGKTQTLAQWSEETGLDHKTISGRLDKYHWTIEKSLTKGALY